MSRSQQAGILEVYTCVYRVQAPIQPSTSLSQAASLSMAPAAQEFVLVPEPEPTLQAREGAEPPVAQVERTVNQPQVLPVTSSHNLERNRLFNMANLSILKAQGHSKWNGSPGKGTRLGFQLSD